MIISKIYNKAPEYVKDGLAGGLVIGLVVGLVGGLVFGPVGGLAGGLVLGLVVGLVGGLVWGLVDGLVNSPVFGLVSGLAGGLVFGLVFGLVIILINFTEAFPFITQFYHIVLIIFGVIILAEIMFWLSKERKPKRENIYWFTFKRKIENVFEVLLGLSAVAQIYILQREIDFVKYYPKIVSYTKYFCIVLIGLVIIGLIILGWLKLNSLKYKGLKK